MIAILYCAFAFPLRAALFTLNTSLSPVSFPGTGCFLPEGGRLGEAAFPSGEGDPPPVFDSCRASSLCFSRARSYSAFCWDRGVFGAILVRNLLLSCVSLLACSRSFSMSALAPSGTGRFGLAPFGRATALGAGGESTGGGFDRRLVATWYGLAFAAPASMDLYSCSFVGRTDEAWGASCTCL